MGREPDIHGTGNTSYVKPNVPPWSYRQRAVPLRTYSGVVVYKKKTPHYWSMKDIARISKKLEVAPIDRVAEPGWMDSVTELFRGATIEMMTKMLPFLNQEQIGWIYETIYEMVGGMFGVDTTGYTDPRRQNQLFSIIERLATLGNFEVAIKKR